MANKVFPTIASYTTTITFDQPFKELGEHTITGAITLVADLTGAQAGYQTGLTLIADGTNTPDLSDFDRGGADNWDNTAGAINQLIFYYMGGRACYVVSALNASGGGGGGDTTAPSRTSIVTEDATPTKVRITYNETLDGTSVPNLTDFILNEASPGSGFTGSVTMGSNYVELTYSTPMANGDVWDLGYTGTAIKDLAGNSAATFSTVNITNNVAGSGSYDPDAQDLYDFNTANSGGTIPNPQKQAYSDFVDGLQADGLYTKFPASTNGSAICPMLGSALSSQKWNARNLADTDAAHRLTGTATHDAVGAKFNGTTQFLDTHIPVNAFAFSAGTLIFYVATRNNVSGGYYCGFISSFNTGLIGVCAQPEGTNAITGLNAVGFFCVKTPTGITAFNPVGLWIVTRDGSGNGEIYHEGNLIFSDTGFNADQGVTTSVYLGGLNKEGTGLFNPSDCKIGFFGMCPNHFSSGDVAAFQARWNTFKTAASK